MCAAISVHTWRGANELQGIVLEASPLPILPLQSLATVDTTRNTFVSVRLDGAHTPCRFHNCQPVILLIDDVLDGGNLGAILRSAYFLGIDAVILTSHCAPLNAVALKAGAGAAEALSIFKAQHPAAFLENSRAAGWHVICATTPRQNGRQSMNKSLIVPSSNIRYHMSSLKDVRSINAKFSSSPQIIVVGGEGRGLRKFLTANTDSFLEILAPRDTSSVGLDSLNVSVAAAMVCNEVLTRMRVGENEERYFKHLEENEKSNLHCERPKQTQNEILEREAEDGNGDEFPALESDMGRAEKQAKDAERNS
jgi:21S rRNA (GM2251-2'-O)-methyltransferase